VPYLILNTAADGRAVGQLLSTHLGYPNNMGTNRYAKVLRNLTTNKIAVFVAPELLAIIPAAQKKTTVETLDSTWLRAEDVTGDGLR
jgi:hypothetical protein